MATLMPALDNITWERVEREITSPIRSTRPDEPGHDVVFDEGFPRPNGLGKLVAAKFTAAGRDARRRVSVHPHDRPPARALAHRRHDAARDHARRAGAGPVAQLSRGTIAKLGIAPGDMVRVSTRRGSIELAARQDDAMPDGVVFIPFAYVEAAANLLTNPALDPFGKIPEFKFCAAKVEPIGPQMEAAE